jgi:hypothetical protein
MIKFDNKLTIRGSMKPVIAIYGPCGSGKSYLLTKVCNSYLLNEKTFTLNIKDMFISMANLLSDDFKRMGYELTEADMKHLCLLIGRFGEERVSSMIWTDQWVNQVRQISDWVINDGIRTKMNFDGLYKVAETRPVILLKLNVSESVRRSRLGPRFRENDVFDNIEKPATLPPNFKWVELDEGWDLIDLKDVFKEYL